jgi:hypothetical protein
MQKEFSCSSFRLPLGFGDLGKFATVSMMKCMWGPVRKGRFSVMELVKKEISGAQYGSKSRRINLECCNPVSGIGRGLRGGTAGARRGENS